MTIKMELTRSEVLTVKTKYGTVLISYLEGVGLSVGTYTDPDSNPVSAVHVRSDGEVIQIHSPEQDAAFERAEEDRRERHDELIAYLDELDAEYGAPSPEMISEARALFDDAGWEDK